MQLVQSGPWKDHAIRTARKAGTCDYYRGSANGGRCDRAINAGDQYVAGELNPLRAGGFGHDRYCLECANVTKAGITR